MIQIEPCLFFSGRCKEAIALCPETLGAELQMVMRYSDLSLIHI